MLSIQNIIKPYNQIKIYQKGHSSKFTKELIEQIIKTTLMHEKVKNPNLSLDVLFCTKEEIQKQNQLYLKNDTPTDIITLKNDHTLEEIQTHKTSLGAILICLPVIKEDAQFNNKNEQHHLAHIIIHGTLHILNYDHKNETDRMRMESKEITILSKLGIKSPYLT